jgi:hypothetical protein
MHARPYVNELQDVNYVLILCFQKVMCQGSGDLFGFIGEGISPFLL